MLGTPFSNINQIQGVFNNFLEGLKVNGGLSYSTYQLSIFPSIDWRGWLLKCGLTRTVGSKVFVQHESAPYGAICCSFL